MKRSGDPKKLLKAPIHKNAPIGDGKCRQRAANPTGGAGWKVERAARNQAPIRATTSYGLLNAIKSPSSNKNIWEPRKARERC